MIKKLLLPVLALALLAPTSAMAKKSTVAEPPVPRPAATSEDNRADVARIEDYLNGLSTLASDFTQTNDRGDYKHGKLALQRPGRMRVTYDAPSKDFIVADGHFINLWDGELGSQSSVPIDASLGDILLREKIAFSGDVKVMKIERAPAKIELTVAASEDVGAGQLTFVFEDRPLLLRGWRIHDSQGHVTTVSLENPDMRTAFPSGTFTFVPPNFGKGHKNSAAP